MISKQLAIFFALAYFFSWVIWWPLYAPALGLPAYTPLPYQHAIGAFGPLIASVVCSIWFNGIAGGRTLLLRMLKPHRFWLLFVSLFGPFILLLIAILINYLQTGIIPDISKVGLTKEFPQFNVFIFFFYNLIFFGFGEETGWHGFALPRLQNRHSALTSSMLLTLFWASWHLPLFLYRPGYLSMDLLGAIGWIMSLLTGSVLLTWLFNSSRGSILICAIFHSAVDVAFTSDYLDTNLVGIMGMLITLWGIATILIFKPASLGKNKYQLPWNS